MPEVTKKESDIVAEIRKLETSIVWLTTANYLIILTRNIEWHENELKYWQPLVNLKESEAEKLIVKFTKYIAKAKKEIARIESSEFYLRFKTEITSHVKKTLAAIKEIENKWR